MRMERVKDSMILIRVARAEKQRLAEIARNRGLSLSDFLRQSAEMAARKEAA